MTDAPDQQQVREIAREAIRGAADYPEYRKWSFRSIAHRNLGIDYKDMGERDPLWLAVVAEMEEAITTVTWFDEILPWPVVVAAGADAGVPEERVQRWRETWAKASGRLPEWPPVLDEPTPPERDVTLDELIEAAHRRRPGFDDDVRAVAEVIAAGSSTWVAVEMAIRKLEDRFADRIAELAARTTDGGVQ